MKINFNISFNKNVALTKNVLTHEIYQFISLTYDSIISIFKFLYLFAIKVGQLI